MSERLNTPRHPEIREIRRRGPIAGLGVILGLLAACTPTVQVAAPEKPIVINLNVKIEHEVRVKLEKAVDDLLKKNSDLF